MSALAKIVGAGVDNDGALLNISLLQDPTQQIQSYANNAVGTNQLHEVVGQGTLSIALSISLNIAHVANMTLGIAGSAVLLAVRVDWERVREASPRERTPGATANKYSQWGPAEVQPLVLSPKVWTWKPRLALGSLPVMS